MGLIFFFLIRVAGVRDDARPRRAAMQRSARGALPPHVLVPNERHGAERPPLTDRPEPWTIVRQVRAEGGQYVESRHAAFASHPSHVHTTPTIALLLRGALEVRFGYGRRLAADALGSALVLP